MRQRWLVIAGAVLALAALGLAGIVASIRSGLQRYSDEAVSRFPGGRVEALMKVVDCAACPLKDRDHAVWALGQMVETRSITVLRKHFDGRPCDHSTRLCQYELRKAIRMIETADDRTGRAARLVARWHRPWR